MFKMTEQQMFDYMYCPAKFEIKHVKGIDIGEPVTIPKLLNKVSKYFYVNLLDKKIATVNELKAKWDRICYENQGVVDTKKNLVGMGMIINLINWASRERIVILDVDTKYNIVIDDIQLVGCTDPLLAGPNGRTELLVTNFSDRLPEQMLIDMKLKHTLDTYAYQEVFGKELSGIRIHSVKANVDLFSRRSEPDFERLKTTIKSVAKGIQEEIFYPREDHMCGTCAALGYCRYWHK
jgi:hypothetical protein